MNIEMDGKQSERAKETLIRIDKKRQVASYAERLERLHEKILSGHELSEEAEKIGIDKVPTTWRDVLQS
jgi:hypothetical protein